MLMHFPLYTYKQESGLDRGIRYICPVHPWLFICFKLDFVFSNLWFIASLLRPSSTKTGCLLLSLFGRQLSKIIHNQVTRMVGSVCWNCSLFG